MPELPEVESVRRALEGGLTGRRVCAARLLTPDVVAHPDAGAFCAALTDRRFAALSRRGKFLVAALDDGARCARRALEYSRGLEAACRAVL